MRLLSYQSKDGPRIAARRDRELVDLCAADPELPTCMRRLLELGPEGLQRAVAACEKAPAIEEPVELLPPVPFPQKIVCVGLNYADHAAESGMSPPSEPVIFDKFPTAASAHGRPVVLPAVAQQVDYEAELVAVIGRKAKNVPAARAREYIAGFTCGNDISARDWQMGKPGGQWLLGKSFDTFAPFGPALVTADEVPEPGRLAISLRLNGNTMQQSSTDQLIFSVDELVAYISQVCTLLPGDVLFTGTPPGVGFARKPPVFLKAGDQVEVEIEGLGVLENPIRAG